MKFITHAICLTLVVSNTLFAEERRLSEGAKKPNVVIFLTDDQGTLDANCYGSKDLFTPNMDKLARTGVTFTQAYAHAVCCPARAALMTGRHPQRSGVNHWCQQHGLENKGVQMAREEVTIAEMLKAAGYRTGLFGKWHLGSASGYGPTSQGFDEFFGIRGGGIENYTHFSLDRMGNHDLYEGEKEIFARGQYFPELMTERTIAFIDRNKDKPFFAYVPLNLPHFPEQADAKFEERYKDYKMPRKSYARVVSTADDRMGRVIDKLEELKLRDNTIIIFMSDNGHSIEPKPGTPRARGILHDNHKSGLPKGFYYCAHGGGGNTGKWIGHKSTFLEGGIRVPAIISYPASLPQGVARDQAVTAMDWLPTIAELCGAELPRRKLDGASLLPVIQSDAAPSPHQIMHWQWRHMWAVRDGAWKLLGEGNKATHLGNLDEENPEVKNHLETQTDIAKRLHQLHKEWAQEVTPPDPSETNKTDPALTRRATNNGKDKPNVVLILSDDMGFADIERFGKTEIPTPALNRLTDNGIRFNSAYVTAPVCMSSRVGLMSGRYQQRFGIYDNDTAPHQNRLQLQATLMPSVFQQAGYRTCLIGKWHLSGRNKQKFEFGNPLTRGFDECAAIATGSSYFKGAKILRQNQLEAVPEYLTDFFGKEASAFIERNRKQPFFLYLAFNAVHGPMQATPSDLKDFAEVEDPNRRTYCAMLQAMDRSIGRVLDQLDKHQLTDNTIVVFLNDNGGGTYNFANNRPLRGHKFDVYEGGIRTPMMIRWPQRFKTPRAFEPMVSSADLYPTLAAAAGLTMPDETFDGVNLLPYLSGKRTDAPHELLCWQSMSRYPKKPGDRIMKWREGVHNSAIRKGNWKLVRTFETLGADTRPAWELYDLGTDVSETKDVSASHQGVVRELSEDFRKWRATMHPPIAAAKNSSERNTVLLK